MKDSLKKNLFSVGPMQHATRSHIKHFARLVKSTEYRKVKKSCVVSGTVLIRELLQRGFEPRTILSTLNFSLDEIASEIRLNRESNVQILKVTDDAMKRASGLKTVGTGNATMTAEFSFPNCVKYSESALTVKETNGQQQSCQYLNKKDSINFSDALAAKKVIILDAVADPGNVGTILRSGLAFGFKSAILLKGCCDPLNPKVIRASRSAQWAFDHILTNACWTDLQNLAESNVFVADSSDAINDSTINYQLIDCSTIGQVIIVLTLGSM